MSEFQMCFLHLSGADFGSLHRYSVFPFIFRNDFRQELSLSAGVDHIQVEIIHGAVIF